MNAMTPGHVYPLGSHYDGHGVNFAIFSAHAEKIELCLFDEQQRETRITLPQRTGYVWHGYLPGIKPGQHYGYRAYGPWIPGLGMRFNPQKLLIDPYSRELSSKPPDDKRLLDSGDTPDPNDSAKIAPKSVVTHWQYDWQGDTHPSTPWSETIIYEAHVSGLTKMHPDLPHNIRGTYAALAHPAIIDYLKTLGITAIELLPVQFHIDEPRLLQNNLTNYWGYNPLANFAVEPDYWSGREGTTPASELRDAVKALHKAGIEVILDIVFNHTAELDFGGRGPTLLFRGLDNPSYYWIDNNGQSENWTGCGNAMRLNTPPTIRLVMDCLRYWVDEFHVDGFRFDLGTALGRTPDFSSHAPLLSAMMQDPQLSLRKLIMEPWDIGPGGYQLGNFPYPFAEWNDHYRDAMRRFWLHGDISLGQFARRFAASNDIFQHHGRSPKASINFITAHDGFTLHDLVSYNQKHNLVNGDENLDGTNNNYSYNFGTEGTTNNPEIMTRRETAKRALLMTVLLSQGTPMLLAGDEISHSQRGNNNAYCQDNEITWFNWVTQDKTLTEFVTRLIAVRKQIPALQTPSWWQEGDNSVRWLDRQANPLNIAQWEQPSPDVIQIQLSEQWLFICNPGKETVQLQLPAGKWSCYLTAELTKNAQVQGKENTTQWQLSGSNAVLLIRQ